jgi:uncharacterized protein YcbX
VTVSNPARSCSWIDTRFRTSAKYQASRALSDHVGRPVQLRPEGAVSHFDEGPLHLVTTASLAALADHHGAPVSTARLRPNLLVDVGTATGFVEESWTGQTLAIGPDLVISIREPMPRCVMVDLAQHGGSDFARIINSFAGRGDRGAGEPGGGLWDVAFSGERRTVRRRRRADRRACG